jgi:uncharacterized protein (DUF983 family)
MNNNLHPVFQNIIDSNPMFQPVKEKKDAYCPECEDYICWQRVTYEETCDKCGSEVEWR